MSNPPDSVTPPGVRTQAQSNRRFSNDKIKTLTKLKLQEYIESFFSESGVNRDLLCIVSPRFIHYNTDKSFDPKTDPTERKLQIARYFAELGNNLPSILIIDGGIEVVPSNMGLIGGSNYYEGQWQGHYPIFRKIPMVILAAAQGVEEADEMSGVLSLLFNELRNLAGGNYITGKQDEFERWVITLPVEPVNVGNLSETDVPGDPIQKIWYSETSLEISYEDTISIQQEVLQPDRGGELINDPDSRLADPTTPEILISDTVSINTQPQIVIRNYQNRYLVILSDSKKATISQDFVLSPRNFGDVTIRVIDPNVHQNENIMAEKTITII